MTMEPRVSIITLGVRDLTRAFDFYHEGLGLPWAPRPEDGIVFFRTGGVVLALYPFDELALDTSLPAPSALPGFNGITIAHVTRSKPEVDALLQRAVDAGGSLVKPAGDTSWGGYSGYFADLDGYLWEIAWAESWSFHPDGSMVLD